MLNFFKMIGPWQLILLLLFAVFIGAIIFAVILLVKQLKKGNNQDD